MFFSFDGIDGVGKSTQLRLFVEWLEGQGKRVVVCRDPGSTPLGEALRDLLLHSSPDRPIGARAEMLMYMAARAQLVDEVIRPALDEGAVVVSDRYVLANIAYQGHAGGLNPDLVARVGAAAIDGVRPDRVYLLDLDPAKAEERVGQAPDRMESRGLDYRRQVREGFLAEASADRPRIVVIDAAGSIDSIQATIRADATALMKAD